MESLESRSESSACGYGSAEASVQRVVVDGGRRRPLRLRKDSLWTSDVLGDRAAALLTPCPDLSLLLGLSSTDGTVKMTAGPPIATSTLLAQGGDDSSIATWWCKCCPSYGPPRMIAKPTALLRMCNGVRFGIQARCIPFKYNRIR